MSDIDCMTCLVREAQGLPCEGAYRDSRGTTHATLLWLAGEMHVTLCTLAWDGFGWLVADGTKRVPR